MSLRFKNRARVYPLPRSWTAPNGRKFAWNSGSELFETFAARVQAHATNNNLPVPSDEEIENHLCQQSGNECTGDKTYHAPTRSVVMTRSKVGKCCGKK